MEKKEENSAGPSENGTEKQLANLMAGIAAEEEENKEAEEEDYAEDEHCDIEDEDETCTIPTQETVYSKGSSKENPLLANKGSLNNR
jgi:septal ring factor EnvC (AmiA/AmiB activator)